MKKKGRWIVPTLIAVVLLGYLGWIIAKGLGTGDHRFFRTEVAPGISGTVFEPAGKASSGLVLLPQTAGWDADQAARAQRLAASGVLVVVIDYYRGGRDSYHGSPNEMSDELWSHWTANLAAGLDWVDAHRRGLDWTIEAPRGRPTDLIRAAAPQNFRIRDGL